MDENKEKENLLERDHNLAVVLPGGMEKTTTVHGSKPVMDLLVTLCARYHLNPSDHSVELLSANRNHITFKPNSPIGSLEAEKILLKPKECEEKIIRRPYMPEATVRLLINYRKSHKAVVRVNPRMPLGRLMSAVCEKCEFDVESTILLRDSDSQEPLDLAKSLNDYGVREVFAKDTAAVSPTDVVPSPPSPSPPPQEVACVEEANLPKGEEKNPKKPNENKGFFRLFRRNKAKPEKVSLSAPASPGVNAHVRANSLGVHAPNSLPGDTPKKRRAPLPPLGTSHSFPANLNAHHLYARPLGSPEGQTLKRTKRRAPPPPCVNAHDAPPQDAGVKGSEASLYTVEELRESKEMGPPSPTPSNPLFHPRGKDKNPSPNTASSGREAGPSASLSLAEILTTSLANARPVGPSKSAGTFPRSSSACNGFPTQPLLHSGASVSVQGSPLKLRPIPRSGSQRGGMTTFTVVPRGSLIRERVFELELSTAVSDLVRKQEESTNTAPAVTAVEPRESQTKTQEMLGSPQSPEAEGTESDSECCTSVSWATDSPSPTSVLPSSESQSFQTSPSPAEETEEDLNGMPAGDTFTSEQGASNGTFLNTGEVALNTGTAVQYHEDEEDEEDSFPPPPPPVFFDEEVKEGKRCSSQEGSLPLSSSLAGPANGSRGDSARVAPPGKKAPDFAAKVLKRTGTVPSRFAQAVALAVQRSQSGAPGGGPCPESPRTLPGSSPISHFPCTNMEPEWLPHGTLNGSSCLG